MNDRATEENSMNAALRQLIEALIARWGKANAEKNLPELLDMITDDAVFVGSTAPPLVGREAIGAHYLAYFEKFNIEINTDQRPEMVLMGDTVVVWTAGRTVLTPLNDTPSLTFANRTMTLFRQEKGIWRISRGLSCVIADDTVPRQLKLP